MKKSARAGWKGRKGARGQLWLHLPGMVREVARVRSPAEIAKRENLRKGYVARLTRLAFVAPSIVEAVTQGRCPISWLMPQRIQTKLGLRM